MINLRFNAALLVISSNVHDSPSSTCAMKGNLEFSGPIRLYTACSSRTIVLAKDVSLSSSLSSQTFVCPFVIDELIRLDVVVSTKEPITLCSALAPPVLFWSLMVVYILSH